MRIKDLKCNPSEHKWIVVGGTECPKGNLDCSQNVYQCKKCGIYDYHEDIKGIAYQECLNCHKGNRNE